MHDTDFWYKKEPTYKYDIIGTPNVDIKKLYNLLKTPKYLDIRDHIITDIAHFFNTCDSLRVKNACVGYYLLPIHELVKYCLQDYNYSICKNILAQILMIDFNDIEFLNDEATYKQRYRDIFAVNGIKR